jgi:hypothetical protein
MVYQLAVRSKIRAVLEITRSLMQIAVLVYAQMVERDVMGSVVEKD